MVTTAMANKPATLETAQAIFARGTDCLGPEEVMRVHGKLHKLKLPKTLPRIPWTEAELKAIRARDEGAHLVLTPPGLTMQAICDQRQNLGADDGKLLLNTDWYKGEKFFTTDTTGANWSWRLVTNEVIPGSADQNYVEQTAVLADYLTKVVFAGRELLDVYCQAIAEFKAKQDKLTKLIDNDWRSATQQLSALTLNRLLRGTPVVTFYDWVTHLDVNGERLSQGMYHWTSILSSYGELVYVGLFARYGADVFDWNPRNRSGSLGVVLSRNAEVESEV